MKNTGKSGLRLDLECSSWPEGNWKECCVEHDYNYADGKNKWKSDYRLALCVSKKGHLGIGVIMFLGLSVLGWPAYLKHKRARNARKNTAD